MLHHFCRLQNIEDFRSQRNQAAEWSRNFLTVRANVKGHVPYQIEVKPVDQSFESLNSEVIYFSISAVFRMLSVSVIRSISRVL